MTNPDHMSIILASASRSRASVLRNAGIEFDVIPAELDERSVEAPLRKTGVDAASVADVLAQAKAEEVSSRLPGALVIGGDQTLALGDRILHKPRDMEEARRRLLELSGRVHQLHSAVCLFREGELVWSLLDTVHIHFRRLDPGFVGRHLALAGEEVLGSVGAYQLEGVGVQLVERVEGDFFSILGLPLVPLLEQLRNLGAIDG